MFKYIKELCSQAVKSRTFILSLLFGGMALILIQRLFSLQIIHGEDYLRNFTMQIKKEREIKSTRGKIYDRNGKLLATNKLAYSVTFEDNGNYDTKREKNLALNSSMYGLLRVIEDNGNTILTDFGIDIDSSGDYFFTKAGISLDRFKADIYGRAFIEDLKPKEKDATVDEMMADLCSDGMYGILSTSYKDSELAEKGLPSPGKLSKEELLKLVIMRAEVAANSYKKYVSTTIAKNINETTVAIIMENKDVYAGVDVVEDSLRVYGEGGDDSIYFAPLIGYTGQISQEEMAKLNNGTELYKNGDIIGKSGLEQTFEDKLQGVDGSEIVYVDNLGKVLKKESAVAPQAGDDIHLTINSDLQIATYQILEQYIAGIVWSMMVSNKEVDNTYVGSDNVRLSVFDAYYALFENNIIDARHLASRNATPHEKLVYAKFLQKQELVFKDIKEQLTTSNPVIYKELSKEMKVYISYVVNDFLMKETGILNEVAIDKADPIYKEWTDTEKETISLKEYLTYAISKKWIDITKIDLENEYLDTTEIYDILGDYIAEKLSANDAFSRKIYKYMIVEENLSGADVCLLLFDQGILEMNQQDYDALSSGQKSAFTFIKDKIYNLEITPAQLALEPCSGSVVITDPKNGDVLACVTYPSYYNNRLANDMDSEYFNILNSDLSSPFYNKATQEVTAPGSTFKLVTATAGVMEGVVTPYDAIECKGLFELDDPPIACWIYDSKHKAGAHGAQTMVEAIEESCNYYFNTIGYQLTKTGPEEQDISIEQGVEKLTKYANMYGLDAPSGIEIPETPPQVSKRFPVATAMGQGENAFTTSQLARYVTTIANNGYCYDLTLLDKITDSQGNTLDEPEPVLHNFVELPSDLWNTIHQGMNAVANKNEILKTIKTDLHFDIAGKTGTAQQSKVKPNHALFIGYAPYQNPEIAIAVRITNGYTSKNAAAVARDVISYHFGLVDRAELLTGEAIQGATNTTTQD